MPVPMQPTQCLRDHHIREALKQDLRQRDGSAAIIEELPLLRGRGRADLAFVNGELWGYEIKSEADSLVRLGMQVEHYERVFEFNTLVAAKKHLKLAKWRIPETWGIIEVKQTGERIVFHPLRQPQRNHRLSNFALARLLWKNECLSVLRRAHVEATQQTPVAKIWSLVEALSTQRLCDEVREALKRRQARFAAQQTPCDGLHTIVATG